MARFIRGHDLPWVPASHENPQDPGVLKRVGLAKGELPTGTIPMVNWARLPVGRSFAPHYHEDMTEVFLFTAGTVAVTVGGSVTEVTAGDAVVIEPHEVHMMKNIGEGEATYIAFGVSTGVGGRTVTMPA